MTSEKPLSEYSGKTDPRKTPEPRAEAKETGMHRFVVQEHHASHLHWDFRLEMDGVLKSWAVPKGPPEEAGVRRLAVQVEDHPVEYIDFEGEIEEGEYGAGQVKIWDSGTFDLQERDDKKLIFVLHGRRLEGGYALIHTREKQWIVLKRKG